MYIRMNFILGVTLLVIQLSTIIALDPDLASEHAKINSEKPTNKENSTNDVLKESMSRRQRDVRKKSKALHSSDREQSDEIVYDVKARRFNRAVEKMQNINEDLQGTMNYIIHELYNNNAGNMDLILQFVDRNNNVTTNLAIFEALNFELDINSHNDNLVKLKLFKSFNSKVTDQSSIPENDQSKADDLKAEIDYSVTKYVAGELKDAMSTNDSKAISTISENIYNNYPALFSKAIRQALNEGFNEISKPYLVELFQDHKHQSQSVFAYSAIFGELRKRNKLSNSLVVTLAYVLKSAMDAGLPDRPSREAASNLKLALPESVRNIAFARRVCIVNADYPRVKEHLYGAVDEFNYNEDRRTLYTWSGFPTGRIENGYWFIERRTDRNAHYIKNERKKGRVEFMYAADFFVDREKSKRYAFTWIRGLPDSEQFNWMFIPSGEHVFIRNMLYGEYLYASQSDMDGDFRRYVYAGKIGNIRMKGSLWTIMDCSTNHVY